MASKWRVHKGPYRWTNSKGSPKCVAADATGTYAAVGEGNLVRVVRLSDGKPGYKLDSEDVDSNSVAFAPDGKTLAWSSEHTLHVADAASGELIAKLQTEDNYVAPPFCYADSETLVWLEWDKFCSWNFASGERRQDPIDEHATLKGSQEGHAFKMRSDRLQAHDGLVWCVGRRIGDSSPHVALLDTGDRAIYGTNLDHPYDPTTKYCSAVGPSATARVLTVCDGLHGCFLWAIDSGEREPLPALDVAMKDDKDQKRWFNTRIDAHGVVSLIEREKTWHLIVAPHGGKLTQVRTAASATLRVPFAIADQRIYIAGAGQPWEGYGKYGLSVWDRDACAWLEGFAGHR